MKISIEKSNEPQMSGHRMPDREFESNGRLAHATQAESRIPPHLISHSLGRGPLTSASPKQRHGESPAALPRISPLAGNRISSTPSGKMPSRYSLPPSSEQPAEIHQATTAPEAPIQLRRRGRGRGKRPKYIDPVKKPEIRYGGIDSPRDEVRRKLGIPPEHFHDPVVAMPREAIQPRDNSIDSALGKLPRAYGNNPDVRRLLESEEDNAHKTVERAMSSKPVMKTAPQAEPGRVREVLAAVEYARQNNLPANDIQSAQGYDFDIGRHKIDPFEVPSKGFPIKADEQSPAGKIFFKTNRDRDGAYGKHTSGTKGGGDGVVGVLDATYSHPDEIARLDEARQRLNIPPGIRQDVRVPLEQEYIKDHIEDTARSDPQKARLWAHRGSDPTKKWGPRDLNRQAQNKARYDRMKKEKEKLKMQNKVSE